MKKNLIVKAILLLAIFLGVSGLSVKVFADKKAVEGQNDADVEFYNPTPKKIIDPPVKPDPKKPDPIKPGPKIVKPIAKILPKTGEQSSFLSPVLGIVMITVSMMGVTYFKVGEESEK